MADINKISFYHLTGSLSTATPENGAIYFSDADHTIGVGVGSEMKKYYGGNVKNAVYAGKKLTISYYDGNDAVLDFNDVASAEGVSTLLSGLRDDIKALRTDVTALQGSSHTHTNKTVLDGITDVKVAAWDAVADKKADYDAHVANADIHVTTDDKTKWNRKQDALTEAQLNAVNSGITADKVNGYDNHLNNQDIHVTTADKTKWNAAEQNAKDYADGLAKNYDAAGAADTALASAKSYVDGKVDGKFDAIGSAATAEQNAKTYTDEEIGKLGDAAMKNVLVGAIADSSSDDLVTAAQVKAYASGVVGAMHFRGAHASTDAIANPASGDICLVGTKEYVYNGTEWVLFGDEGAYDTKGSAAQALASAKKYTDDAKTAVLGNANTDTKESATIVGAKKYTDAAKSEVLGNAETDTKDSATIVGAKKYTDDAKSTVIGVDGDTSSADTIYGAKKYADEAISAALVWKQF